MRFFSFTLFVSPGANDTLLTMARRCPPASISPPNFRDAGKGTGTFVNVNVGFLNGAASARESVSSVVVVPFFTQFRR